MGRVLSLGIVMAAMVVAGCRAHYAKESVTFPPIGTVVSRGVGESLIRLDTGYLVPDIEILHDSPVGDHMLARGRYLYGGENSKGVWFSGDGEYFYVRKKDGMVCIDETKQCADVSYNLEKRLSEESPDSFQQTLLYNGRIGNRITLAYREFSDNLARPAFSNNVEYDLSESTIVGYKGARLEVIEATNTEIRYRVLSGFQ